MASLLLNTKAENMLANGMGLRELLRDCVMDIYSGTPPTYADDAATGLGGVKLCRVTKASGTVTAATSTAAGSGDYSTPQKTKLVFADHDTGDIIDLDVTIDSIVYNVLFTDSAAAIGDHTLILIAAECARQINFLPGLHAVSDGVDTVWVQCKIGGLAFTIADGGSTGSSAPTITDPVAQSRASVNTLQFGPPTAGVLSKTSDVWSGTVLATGVAGWGRFVWPNDTGGLVTLTEPRVQFDIATSGAVYNISNTTLTVGATHTVDSFTLTVPKLRT